MREDTIVSDPGTTISENGAGVALTTRSGPVTADELSRVLSAHLFAGLEWSAASVEAFLASARPVSR